MLVTLFGAVSCLFGMVSIWHGFGMVSLSVLMLTKACQITPSNHPAKALG